MGVCILYVLILWPWVKYKNIVVHEYFHEWRDLEARGNLPSPTSSTPAASNIYSFTSFSNYLANLFICLKE